ncbi:hypothetical protein [Arthrobacter sp. STN4]|uniref:hypothetical protein n=1 Tax=Arthrobacter sp. STN4 TaxID=2923276 RepID=UPI00211A37A8|nr:hypothetical protein [Arthrobacter sp. STN4]MCQ9163003.1 hypothetical protein [Arthrobacter sp. STN4]
MQTLLARLAEIFPSTASRIGFSLLLSALLVTGGVVAANAAGSTSGATPDAPVHSELLEKGQASQPGAAEEARQIEAILGL